MNTKIFSQKFLIWVGVQKPLPVEEIVFKKGVVTMPIGEKKRQLFLAKEAIVESYEAETTPRNYFKKTATGKKTALAVMVSLQKKDLPGQIVFIENGIYQVYSWFRMLGTVFLIKNEFGEAEFSNKVYVVR